MPSGGPGEDERGSESPIPRTTCEKRDTKWKDVDYPVAIAMIREVTLKVVFSAVGPSET